MTRITEEELLSGWLASNFRKPTPKDFGSVSVGIGSRADTSRAVFYRNILENAFRLKAAAQYTAAEVAQMVNLPENLVEFAFERTSVERAIFAVQYIERAADDVIGTTPEEFILNKFRLDASHFRFTESAVIIQISAQPIRVLLSNRQNIILHYLVDNIDKYSDLVEITFFSHSKRMPRNGLKLVRLALQDLIEQLAKAGVRLYRTRGKGFRLGLE